MIHRLTFLALFAMVTFGSHAADIDGHFAIKGAGVQTCSKFIAAWDQGNTDLKQYAGWVAGYVTGTNQHVAKTYDTSPWQTTETLLGMMHVICGQLPPDTRFHDAVAQLLRQLWPTRLNGRSELQEVSWGNRSILVYRAVLDAAKARLTFLGYDAGSPGVDFDQKASEAFQAFQQERGLEISGLPDQKTLFELFIRKSK